ncbi:MAG: four helix bundle protein [Crocinitomicaceae bacterium]|nr:four helix bundle protein [Crocinitomicaceae bacterium]
MSFDHLKKRTIAFSASIALLTEKLPERKVFYPCYNQLVRASGSVGANYRAACRAKSPRDFVNKLKIVEEECDECMFFLELICEIDSELTEMTQPYWKEANEILSIMVASINTSRKKSS